MSDKKLKLIKLYPDDDRVSVKVGQPELSREWMDNTPDKYAYRCLPLNIANQHGWAVYPKHDIVVIWDGGNSINSVNILDSGQGLAASAFGSGILTIHMPFLVRTPDDYNIYISGAPNHLVDGAKPFTGIYESDWAPYSFTMNWQLTDPNKRVVFTQKDPICFFFPVHRTLLDDFEMEIENFDNQDDEFRKQHYTFVMSRDKFLKGETGGDDWQKNYFQGKLPDGSKCPVTNHKTKVKLKTDDINL